MAVLRSFRALRPRPDLASEVASVPYDVVDTTEARELAAGNPHSFLHVVRPEIDLPPETDIYDDEVYAQAPRALERLVEQGSLVRDAEKALYLYRQIMGDHAQIGVVGCASVDEYDQDLIKKHEKTRPDKEDDRTRHVLTLCAHAGPVFLTYRGTARIDAVIDSVTSTEAPLYDFVAVDGVAHTVWRVPDSVELEKAFQEVPALYVADGHHRAASASRARAARREQAESFSGEEEVNFFLTVLFPGEQLKILPYNRVVRDLFGASRAEFLERLREVMKVTPGGPPSPDHKGAFSIYVGGEWFQVEAPPEAIEADHPVESLDAAILQERVLGPILGIENPQTSTRIDFVGGIRGTDELARRVRDHGGGVAFSLFPLSVGELLAVADAGLVLPPKSTWFEPKLRSGLLIHEF
ncbi:MAG: DUF1015 family protein [Acidobacteria bacterium]|nr:DUF1015 family protein [Acidobacteriota bacterium]